jgi:hypothetical protein
MSIQYSLKWTSTLICSFVVTIITPTIFRHMPTGTPFFLFGGINLVMYDPTWRSPDETGLTHCFQGSLWLAPHSRNERNFARGTCYILYFYFSVLNFIPHAQDMDVLFGTVSAEDRQMGMQYIDNHLRGTLSLSNRSSPQPPSSPNCGQNKLERMIKSYKRHKALRPLA